MKNSFSPLVLILIFALSCGQSKTDSSADEASSSTEHNRKFATMYHDLNPDNIDTLFTEDFKGHGENGFAWDREKHRNYLSNGSYKVDTIKHQVAEGDWVATWFVRTGLYRGDTISVPIMHFKRFEDGKIAELWEYADFRPPED
jgi:predicted ester cyclase